MEKMFGVDIGSDEEETDNDNTDDKNKWDTTLTVKQTLIVLFYLHLVMNQKWRAFRIRE